MAHYRYLLWDLDGTILNFGESEKATLRALFAKYGLGECPDEKIARYSAINAKYWEKLERREMTRPQILVERFREFFGLEGIDISLAEAFNVDYQMTLGETIIFNDDVTEILRAQQADHVLALVTNGNLKAQEKKIERGDLAQYFQYIFISDPMGYDKPHPEYFRQVFEQMGIGPDELGDVLIIGDSLTSDMAGGVNAGIDTCWYNKYHAANGQAFAPNFEIHDLHELEGIV